ncbi:MAG TPA: tetratricopeptide repeat protein, partial [Isosphaeraceae bacterium]|nr:tetratricopeptide repeat protein [Isosphaeraceae bacterium]
LTEPAQKLAAFRELARTARYDELPPISLDHLGNALIWSGDRQAGSDLLRAAVRIHPRDVWLNYDLAVSLERLGKTREAIGFYMAARALRPETAHELAHALENVGETDEAIAIFQDLARLRPKNGRHLCCLGNACQARGRTREADQAFEAAVAALRETIRLQPRDFRAHSLLGLALNAQGKRSEAIAAYREAIRLQPHVAYVHNNLGLALSAQGKLDEAIAEYRTAIRLQPDDPSAHNLLGIALRGQGKVDEAIVEYRTAIRLAPDHAVAHNNLGYALGKQGKRDEAIAEFRSAIRLKPDLAYAHGNLIRLLRTQGKLEEADAAERVAIRLLPESAMLHNSLAWALVLPPKRPQRDYDEGLVHARKAAELAPKEANHLGTLALAEYRSGHWAESIAASHRAMALRSGGNAYDWFLLALAHGQKGENNQARTWFDKAVALMKEKALKDKEVLQLWAEAAALLGQPGPDASGLVSPAGPAREKPR